VRVKRIWRIWADIERKELGGERTKEEGGGRINSRNVSLGFIF